MSHTKQELLDLITELPDDDKLYAFTYWTETDIYESCDELDINPDLVDIHEVFTELEEVVGSNEQLCDILQEGYGE